MKRKPVPKVDNIARVNKERVFDISADIKNGENVNERLSKAGFPFTNVGENLAIASTIRSGHQSFMQSDSHRNTILDNEFRRVGIGVVSGPIGLLIVQVFS